eukprot:1136769-Prorocentrum_minimum.AAC.1
MSLTVNGPYCKPSSVSRWPNQVSRRIDRSSVTKRTLLIVITHHGLLLGVAVAEPGVPELVAGGVLVGGKRLRTRLLQQHQRAAHGEGHRYRQLRGGGGRIHTPRRFIHSPVQQTHGPGWLIHSPVRQAHGPGRFIHRPVRQTHGPG